MGLIFEYQPRLGGCDTHIPLHCCMGMTPDSGTLAPWTLARVTLVIHAEMVREAGQTL